MKRLTITILLIFCAGTIWYFGQDRSALYMQQDVDTNMYKFNKHNNIQSVQGDKKRISFIYNEFNRRRAKLIDGIVVEKYHWQGDEKLHLVTDGQDRVLREYLYKDKLSDLPFGMLSNGQKYLFVYNPMKSLRLVLTEQKKLVKAISYNSKGERIQDSNRNFIVDFSYAAGIEEPDSKLLLFSQGVYNPETGRWLSRTKNDDVIENLKALNQIENDQVYQCSDTLDSYYHSYLCVKGKCGGLYATEYLNYFNGSGYMLDNSDYFKPSRCSVVSLSAQHNKKRFASCVEAKIQPRHVPLFDVIKHNCHHEVADILQSCKTHSYEG